MLQLARVWWRNPLLDGKGSGAAGGVQTNTWSMRPGAAGAQISALPRAGGRVKQINQSCSVIPWSGQHFVSKCFSYTWQKNFKLHASLEV